MQEASRLGLSTQPPDDAWVAFVSNAKKNIIRQRQGTALRWFGVLLLAIALAVAGWAVWIF
jgi:hypothetical protein